MRTDDVPDVYRILGQAFRARRAPIHGLIAIKGRDPFTVLVAALLSTRTQDALTAAVCRRVFAAVRGPGDFEALSLAEVERLIYPIGFYKTKARHLKALPGALRERCGGRIPDTVEALCELPGVGRKVANLVVARAFGRPAICVDIHVHRICNRLGLVRTGSPHATEMALRRLLPERFWIGWNERLVAFGQLTCQPIRPRCGDCPLARYCNRVGVRLDSPRSRRDTVK